MRVNAYQSNRNCKVYSFLVLNSCEMLENNFNYQTPQNLNSRTLNDGNRYIEFQLSNSTKVWHFILVFKYKMNQNLGI